MEINKTFTARIQQTDNGFAIIVWPESVAFFGSTKSVKVKGTMDGQSFQTAFMPWGDGTQFLMVSKKLLKAMDKKVGDEITVHLEESVPPQGKKLGTFRARAAPWLRSQRGGRGLPRRRRDGP